MVCTGFHWGSTAYVVINQNFQDFEQGLCGWIYYFYINYRFYDIDAKSYQWQFTDSERSRTLV
jgi:hypothetical protein